MVKRTDLALQELKLTMDPWPPTQEALSCRVIDPRLDLLHQREAEGKEFDVDPDILIASRGVHHVLFRRCNAFVVELQTAKQDASSNDWRINPTRYSSSD